MIESRAVIIGAGPAGMAAALQLVQAGIRPLLIDENPRPGGQIYRQPPAAFQRSPAYTPSALVQRFAAERERMDVLYETSVWGLFPPKRLAAVRRGHSFFTDAQHLIVATGAHEYLPPFPGWTLPGVMTPGAAQALVKGMGVVPGRRVLIAGTGPFLLVVAGQLQRAGVTVAAIVEMAPGRALWRAIPGLAARPDLCWQGLRYLMALRWAGIPIYRKHLLIEARGQGEVTEAVFAPCDAAGYPERSRSRTVAVDTICAGYGFVPRIQLAQLAGCQLCFDEACGGWVPLRGPDLETTVSGLWVAGDGGGVGGALAAELEGSLAGLAVGTRLGMIGTADFQRQRKSILRRLTRLRRFRDALAHLYPLRPGLATLAAPDTLLCRCEELSRREIEDGIDVGGTDLRTLKVMTRLGMGPCQGQMCWPATARFIAQRTGQTVESLGSASVRPPIIPLTLDELIEEEEPENAGSLSVARVEDAVPP